MTYARRTQVPVHRSRSEIERLLQKAGASRIVTGSDAVGIAVVAFVLGDRLIKFELRFDDFPQDRLRLLPQMCRERWRALALAIKAKLVSVEAGIETVEEAFLAHVVTETGQTVAQVVIPRLAGAYGNGGILPMLGPGAATGG